MEKGKLEAFMEAARNLLSIGVPVDDISKATGLSREQLAAIQRR
jgi:hypothetical protein